MDPVQLLDHVDRDADRPGLVGDGAGDRLADPPGRVGRELVAAAVVELLDRADQAERALLNQVEEAEAAAEVTLGDRDDQAQVGLDHLALGLHVAALDALGQFDLLLGVQEFDLADRAQVEAQGVEGGLAAGVVGDRDRSHDFFGLLDRPGHAAGGIFLADQLDAEFGEVAVKLLDLLVAGVEFRNRFRD